MFLVDSHCHLNLLDLTNYQDDLSHALAYAASEGVGHFLCVGINLIDFPEMAGIANEYPNISLSIGLHPNETVAKEPSVDDVIKLAQHEKIIAVGETGLDYYRSEGDLEWQRDRFRQHIRAAIAVHKPLIIHTRAARQDTLTILREENAERVGGVMHCFTEDWETAKAALDLGFYISFSGIVTFKNAIELQDVARRVPLDRLLIETDAPYLAPVPYRGKPNQPAYIRQTAEYLAALRGISFEVFAEQTTENFFRCFSGAKK